MKTARLSQLEYGKFKLKKTSRVKKKGTWRVSDELWQWHLVSLSKYRTVAVRC